MTEQYCEAMTLVCDLALKLGVEPITKFEGCWEHDIDAHWSIAVNGHKEPKESSKCGLVQPYDCNVFFNGWPAGTFNPFGGIMVAGTLANESELIAALKSAIGEIVEAAP